jgi:type II secretion system protein H
MNQRAITLIELIVIWAIVGLCAVSLLPMMNTWAQRDRLKTAAQEVAYVLRIAEEEAVTRGAVCRVRFDPGANSYILQENAGGLWVDKGDLRTLPEGVRMKKEDLPGSSVIFYPNTTSSPGSLTLTNRKGEEKKITLTASTGRIRIE